jgi:excisionase family DNA binding protein
MQQETEVLSVKEAAATLRISPRQVARLLIDGHLPSFRIGSRRLVRRATLARFVALLEANNARQAA